MAMSWVADVIARHPMHIQSQTLGEVGSKKGSNPRNAAMRIEQGHPVSAITDKIHDWSPEEFQNVRKRNQAEEPHVHEGPAVYAEIRGQGLLDYSEGESFSEIKK